MLLTLKNVERRRQEYLKQAKVRSHQEEVLYVARHFFKDIDDEIQGMLDEISHILAIFDQVAITKDVPSKLNLKYHLTCTPGIPTCRCGEWWLSLKKGLLQDPIENGQTLILVEMIWNLHLNKPEKFRVCFPNNPPVVVPSYTRIDGRRDIADMFIRPSLRALIACFEKYLELEGKLRFRYTMIKPQPHND